MVFLLTLLIGLGWSFFIVLLVDRPDLAATVRYPWPWVIQAVFGLWLLRTLISSSLVEINKSTLGFFGAVGVVLRNLIVLALGLLLMLYTCRLVMQGIDPTGHRRLW